MSLDCVTPRGKIYIEHQMKCIRAFEKATGASIFPTSGEDAADVDAIAVRDGKVCSVMEIKSREMSLEELRRFGSYLITFEKLTKLARVSAALGVPGFLAVYLLDGDNVAYWKICDSSGNLLPTILGKISQTQATCNGGLTNRYNAYIQLDEMRVFNALATTA